MSLLGHRLCPIEVRSDGPTVSECGVEQRRTFESKDNFKNNYDIADLSEIIPASSAIPLAQPASGTQTNIAPANVRPGSVHSTGRFRIDA
jgi:hypothetical protein